MSRKWLTCVLRHTLRSRNLAFLQDLPGRERRESPIHLHFLSSCSGTSSFCRVKGCFAWQLSRKWYFFLNKFFPRSDLIIWKFLVHFFNSFFFLPASRIHELISIASCKQFRIQKFRSWTWRHTVFIVIICFNNKRRLSINIKSKIVISL